MEICTSRNSNSKQVTFHQYLPKSENGRVVGIYSSLSSHSRSGCLVQSRIHVVIRPAR